MVMMILILMIVINHALTNQYCYYLQTFSILEPKYEKGDRNPHQLLNIDSDKMRLMKVSESIYTNGNWLIKSEDGEGLEEVSSSSRGLYSEAAFFHFRHWDDFLSKSVSTSYSNKIISSLYSKNIIENDLNNCMVSLC